MLGFHSAQIKRLDRFLVFFVDKFISCKLHVRWMVGKTRKDQIQKEKFDGYTVYTRH